jgi:hypothetical protein
MVPEGVPRQIDTAGTDCWTDGTHEGCRYKYVSVNHVAATLVAVIL